MIKASMIVVSSLLVAALLPTTYEEGDGPHPFLRFFNRANHVELQKTRGVLDLQKPFTIELWARWNTDILDKMMYLAGDEAWPEMNPNVPVADMCGWVIRITRVQDADKQAVDFTVAASTRGKREWLRIVTPQQRIQAGQWHHIAICRTAWELRIYWNGKLAAKKTITGVTLHSSPTNVYLGVRKDAGVEREFVGDIRGFQITQSVRYSSSFIPEMPLKMAKDAVVFLDFSAADDIRVPDSSPHKRDGLIVGAKLIKPTKP